MPNPVKTLGDAIVFPANSSTQNEFDSAIVPLANGRFRIVFTDNVTASNPNIESISLTASGAVLNSTSFGFGATIDELNASATQLGNGSVVYVWAQSNDATPADVDIACVIVSSTGGLTIVPTFTANAGLTAGGQYRPEVAALSGDRFVVTWIDDLTFRVSFAVFNAAGIVEAAPQALSTGNATQAFGAFRLSTAALTGGTAVVCYRTDTFDVKFRMVNAGGSLGPETDYDGAAGSTGSHGVAALADGRFIITCGDSNAAGFTGLTGRIFNADSTPSTAEFQISSISGATRPSVTSLLDGRLFVAFAADNGDINGQIVNSDGTKTETPFTINTVTTGTQNAVSARTLADGRVAVSWTTNEGGTEDIKLTIYDPREAGVNVEGTTDADEYIGSNFDDIFLAGAGNDTISGGAGNDRLDGGRGIDIMSGGTGDDIYFVDNGNDLVGENLNEGFDSVIATITTTLSANLEQLVLVGSNTIGGVGNALANNIAGNGGANVLGGGDGNDVIFALAGADLIDGGIGDDVMAGGTENDVYFVDSNSDSVLENANEGIDTVWTTVNYVLPDTVEILILNGGGSINGFGNDLSNALLGNAGNNGISAFGNNDVILGQGGNDTILGGAGSDVISGGTGGDILTGDSEQDTFVYANINEAGDIITDFSTVIALNDVLDLRVMFSTFTGAFGTTAASAIASGHLTMVQAGADTNIFVDANGGAHGVGEQVLLLIAQNANAAAMQGTVLIV
ncbi:MAG: calcium-binding protein [Bosea sp. (in: a-proteobacteria)]